MLKIKPIYMSCEVQRRELNARLFFAVAAAARGYTSIISQKLIMRANLPNLPAGIFWHKTVSRQCGHYYALARQRGSRTVGNCEEIINIADNDYGADYAKIHYNEATAEHVDVYMSSTSLDTRMAKQMPFGNVISLGNTRIELLRPHTRALYRPEVQAIKQRFGDFVLITSSFGLTGSFRPVEEERAGYDTLARDMKRDYFSEQRNREQGGIATIVLLSERLQAEGRTVVVRPHPHENPQTWRDRLQHLPNVFVEDSGPIVPWLLAADAVLQGNCTTGLEALLLDKRVGNFMSETDQMFSSTLVPALGPENALKQIQQPYPEGINIIRKYIYGVDTFVVQETLDAFDALDPPECSFSDIVMTPMRSAKNFGADQSMERRWPLLDQRECKLFVKNAAAMLGVEGVGVLMPAPNMTLIAPFAAMQSVAAAAANPA